MMDVSDGLVKDAERMARASGVLIELLPADPVRLERDGITREMYYFGGEDHGLLAAFPDAASVPEGWSVLGAVRAGKGVEGPELDTLTRDTWDHFSSDEQQEHSLYG
jgi:thiamine-monophosphate kinase